MQIGIDVGATKIEYILLHDNGEETNRSRIKCPTDYSSVIKNIKEIVTKIERDLKKEVPVGVCHPGIHSIETGLIKNSPNCDWINNKPFQKDLRNAIGREIFYSFRVYRWKWKTLQNCLWDNFRLRCWRRFSYR